MNEICGYQNVLHIFGGRNSDPHEYPWAVLLTYQKQNSKIKASLCGGVLISQLHILTAAHCIVDADEKGYRIASARMGHANVNEQSSFSIEVAKTTVHPEYRKFKPFVVNDIAIVHLKKEVQIDGSVRPICLPKAVSNEEEGMVIVIKELNLDLNRRALS